MQCDSDDKTGARLCGDTDNDSSATGVEAETLDVNKPGCCGGILHGGAVSCRQESDSGISCGVHIEDGHLVELTNRLNAMGIDESAGSNHVSKADTCCVSLEEGRAGSRCDDVKITSDAENPHKACDVIGDNERKLYRTEVSLYVSHVNNDGESNSEVLRGVSHVSNGYCESEVLEEVSQVNDHGQGNPEVQDLSRVKDEITTNGQSDLDVQVKDSGQSKTEVLKDESHLKVGGHCCLEAHDFKETNGTDSKSLVNNVELEAFIKGQATDDNRKNGQMGETEQCARLPHSQCNGRLSPCGSCDKSRIDVGTPSNVAPADAGSIDGEKQTYSTLGLLHNTKYQKKLEVRLKV